MIAIYILFLTGLDLLTKWLWETYQITRVIYNPHIGMGIPANNLVKRVLPVLILPLIIYYAKKNLNPSMQTPFIVLLISGGVGNYVGRLSDKGVIDFIPFPFTNYYFNLADVYIGVLQIMIIWIAISRLKKPEPQDAETIVSK